MKPFDLAKVAKGEPVVTRGGRVIQEIYYFSSVAPEEQPVVAIIDGVMEFFNKTGRYFRDEDTHLSKDDLFMAEPEPEKEKMFLHILKDEYGRSEERRVG